MRLVELQRWPPTIEKCIDDVFFWGSMIWKICSMYDGSESRSFLETMWQIALMGEDWPSEELNDDVASIIALGNTDLEWKKIHEEEACHALTCLQSENSFMGTKIFLEVDYARYNYRMVYRNADCSLSFAQQEGGTKTIALKQLNSLILRAEINVLPGGHETEVTLRALSGETVVACRFGIRENMYMVKWHLLQRLRYVRKLTDPELSHTELFLAAGNAKWPTTGSLMQLREVFGVYRSQQSMRNESVVAPVAPQRRIGRFARRTLLKKR